MTREKTQTQLNRISALIPFAVGINPTLAQTEAGKDIQEILDEISADLWNSTAVAEDFEEEELQKSA